MLLNCGVWGDSLESLGLQGDPTSPSSRNSVLNIHWKDWHWNWNSNTLATWCKELTHLKRSWCWERLKAGGEGDDRGWDGWMASLIRWTWVWADSGSWWRTGRPGVLWFLGSQRVGHDWAIELNWTEKIQSVTVSTVSPSICHEVMGPDAMILVFWMLCFKPALSLSSFTFIKRLFSSSSLSAIRVVSSAYLRLLIFLSVTRGKLLHDHCS